MSAAKDCSGDALAAAVLVAAAAQAHDAFAQNFPTRNRHHRRGDRSQGGAR
jgi:hypothetical protein